MNKKAFTLVELLGVLIILGILGILVSQSIINRVQESNEKTEELAKDILISSARDYVYNNPDEFLETKDKTYCLTYDYLVQTIYLNEGMIPKIDKVNYLKSYYISVIYNGVSFDYDVVKECTAN
ncbi:MAG: prepilin-type N-terminal cleavage/methylation domain-containing protein [Bacilli bacterium]|nr:prepilin-type N-terminal cleavage/methylation domain-containing protein [Bacilli bacterium]